MTRPRWLICEDGTEYLDRYHRFLDGEFEFAGAPDALALVAALDDSVAGVVLDLDFRRTPPERLVDEHGACPGGANLSDNMRARLAERQGLHVLRLVRARGHAHPVLLCADLDEDQASWLTQSLGPLEVVPSHEGLRETAARLRRLSSRG